MPVLALEYLFMHDHHFLLLIRRCFCLAVLILARGLESGVHSVCFTAIYLFILGIFDGFSDCLSFEETSSLHFFDLSRDTSEVALKALAFHGHLTFFMWGLSFLVNKVSVPFLKGSRVRLIHMLYLLLTTSSMT